MQNKNMRILIADDHTIVRRGLLSILAIEFPNAVIAEAKDAVELLEKAATNKWDIIISDISMPGGRSGIEVLTDLKQIAPKTPVLFLSSYTVEQYAVRTIKAGAAGYLTKQEAPEELVKAVRQVLNGKKYITMDIAELLAVSYDDDKPIHESLSDREFEILKLIAASKTVSEIAELLSVSVNTVATYRSRILDKMNMTSNAQLVHYTITNKLF